MIHELSAVTGYGIAEYSLKKIFQTIPSPEINHNTSTVEGMADLTISSQLNSRVISVEFLYQTKDIYDYYLLRDQINALFTREEAYYLIFKREPYKRYKVKLASAYELPPHPHMASFTVEFIMQGKYAESVAMTGDLKEWDVDKWGWNDTIEWDDSLQYLFRGTNSFAVHNRGTAPVDPRESYLQIVIGATASSLRIRNTTTGDVYEYNAPLTSSDILIVEGVRTLKNGVSAFKDTNKKLITLATGINNFVIEGGTVHSIAFNFRFLFK